MAPPKLPLGALLSASPLAIVRPAMVTVPPLTAKTRVVPPPLTVRWLAPGPSIVRLEAMAISLASGIVPFRPGANRTVSAPEATPARSVPGPLSARLVTVYVLGTVRSSRAVNRGGKGRRQPASGPFRPRLRAADGFRSHEEKNIIGLLQSLVCGRMTRPPIPARRPDAGAGPGR